MARGFMPGGGGGGTASDELTATKAQVLEGVTAVTTDSDDEAVEGTMPDRGNNQYGKAFSITSDYVAINQLPEGYYHQTGGDGSWAPEARLTKDIFKTYIQSVTNFKVAQYSSTQIIGSWTPPTSGMWSGIRVRAKQGSYPSNENDGTQIWEGAGASFTVNRPGTGNWYFSAFPYLTTSGGRIYKSTKSDVLLNIYDRHGRQVFNASGTFTVPEAVWALTRVFIVGGGASGLPNTPRTGEGEYRIGRSGGGSGYTQTFTNLSVSPGQQLAVVVGAGGAAAPHVSGDVSATTNGNTGGDSYINGLTPGNNAGGWRRSGDTPSRFLYYGGSGGGRGGTSGIGGYDGGSDGGDGYYNGSGQGTTTREFGVAGAALYAGGGGGGGYVNGSGGVGGDGGGGSGGGDYSASLSGSNGTNGLGGGGGGTGGSSVPRNIEGTFSGAGGSGVVIIEW